MFTVLVNIEARLDPVNITILTIRPAVRTPRAIARELFFLSIPRNQAPRHPVQAPVIGSGIATNIESPMYPYLLTSFLTFSTFGIRKFLKKPIFMMTFSNRARKMKAAGITQMFPQTPISYDLKISIPLT